MIDWGPRTTRICAFSDAHHVLGRRRSTRFGPCRRDGRWPAGCSARIDARRHGEQRVSECRCQEQRATQTPSWTVSTDGSVRCLSAPGTFFPAESEQALLQSLCDILVSPAVSVGLAWIGYCEDDAEKTIRPAGRRAGIRPRLRWSASRRRGEHGSRSAASRHATRPATACWLDDIRAETRFPSWRALPRRRLRFVFAVPLVAVAAGGAPWIFVARSISTPRSATPSMKRDRALYRSGDVRGLCGHRAPRPSGERPGYG